MRGLLASLLFISLVACSTNAPSDAATGSSGSATPVAPGPMTVRFTYRPGDGDATPSATGGTGTIAVRGALATPTPCQVLTGTGAREGRTITLTVASRATQNVCAHTIGTFTYDATLAGGLEAGTYSLRVVHTYPGTGWETKTALTKDVQVR